MKTIFLKGISLLILCGLQNVVIAQTPKSSEILVSNAELGTFPYLKSLPNTYPRNSSDSVTLEQNKVYVFDGKQFQVIEGRESKQLLGIRSRDKVQYSVAQLISEYTKLITTLGGKKLFEGRLPEAGLKAIAGTSDMVDLASSGQLAPNAHMGIVQYVIKTPQREVWVQLQPYTINSEYFGLVIIEKETKLINGNTNKENTILKELEKAGAATAHFSFEPDKDILLTESKDELLNLIGIFQKHPDWKIQLEFHSAPVGDPEYTLQLTQSRALALKNELSKLGVKPSNVESKGFGDQKPLVPNKSELARIKNTRVEIRKIE
jgi:OmpA-OmpF porin, OOP family